MNKKCALVTGCSRGIGKAITEALLEHNRQVVGISRSGYGTKGVQHYRADLSELNALSQVLKEISAKHQITTLICNAATGRFGALEQFSDDQIIEQIKLNLTSQILLIRHFLPLMKITGQGDVVLIGSEAALLGGKNGTVYSACKHGLRGFAQALRAETSTSGIRVGIINPGMVNTSFFDQLHFQPGQEEDQHLVATDVADAVMQMLNARTGAVIEEINVQPQKRTILFKRNL